MTPNSLPSTETRNPLSMKLDSLPTLQMVQLMNQQDATVPIAIAQVLPQIAQTVDIMAAALAAGHRVFYQGAGTSGRLAVLDAVELLPTFRLHPNQVIALLAGGDGAMMRSVEGAEDDEQLGRADLARHDFNRYDVLLGVAASGRTPYALGGLHYAAELGAQSAALVCNAGSPMAQAAQIAMAVVVGPEVLTGSTRLKAGTAQKLVLNMLSTCTMVKLGKVYENLMVDVQPSNQKLRQRATRIVGEIAGLTDEQASALLAEANGEVKTAVVMGLLDVPIAEAQRRLDAAGGHIRRALDAQT